MKRYATMLLTLALVGAGCGGEDGGGGSGPSIVATTTILGDVVGELTGGAANVEVLMPVGADPHDFQASARQAELLREADLVVASGLGLEEGLHDLLESAEAEGTAVIEVGDLIDPLPFSDDAGPPDDDQADDEHADDDDADDEPSDDDHGHGEADPHFWHDPLRMATAVEQVADRLTELDGSIDWSTRAADYAASLRDLDAEIVETLAPLPPEARRIVTNHESFGYFAHRYGFEVIGAVIPGGSTLAEPSPAHLADLVAAMEDAGVRAVFAENTDAAALADAVAAELQTPVEVHALHSDSLGEPGSDAETYAGMLRSNARTIAEALG